MRERLRGIEHADSPVADLHAWMSAPLDCGAPIGRDPKQARAVRMRAAARLAGGPHPPRRPAAG
ncbi:hypothetical protein ACWD6R_04105 [Streptomyces sp. NPDC005151]